MSQLVLESENEKNLTRKMGRACETHHKPAFELAATC
jgi:hypothetical protein